MVGSNEDWLGTRVVKSMVEPLYDRGHHIYMDNFFSNVFGGEKYIHNRYS